MVIKWSTETSKKIDVTGSSKRRAGTSRPRTARNNENMEQMQELVLSQEDKPQSHLTLKEKSLERLAFQKLPCMKLSRKTVA